MPRLVSLRSSIIKYYSQICCTALRVCKLRMGFSVLSIIWVGGGVNANHNATHSLSLARKNKTENDPKLLKNREGNRDHAQVEFLLRAGGRHCFILAKGKNKKDHKKLRRKLVDHRPKQCETGWSQAGNLETQKQNKVDRNAPITSKHVFPKRFAKMIDGTEKP